MTFSITCSTSTSYKPLMLFKNWITLRLGESQMLKEIVCKHCSKVLVNDGLDTSLINRLDVYFILWC